MKTFQKEETSISLRKPHPMIAALGLLVLLVAFGVAILQLNLKVYVLLFVMVPVILSAFYYGRAFYYSFTLVLAAGTFGLSYLIPGAMGTAIEPVAVMVPCSIFMSEMIRLYTRSRRKTEIALQESEIKFRRFIEQSEDGIILVDEEGTIIEWNRMMESISGIKRSDAVTKPYWDVVYKLQLDGQRNRASYETAKSAMKNLLQTGRTVGVNEVSGKEFHRADGTIRRVQGLVFPIKSDKGYMAGNIIRDITERKQTEETIRETNEKLTTLVSELQHRNQEAAILNEMGDMLQSCLAEVDAYDVVSQFASKIFPEQSGILYVLDTSLSQFIKVAAWGNPSEEDAAFALEGCWALRRGRTHLVSETSNRLLCQHLGPSREPGRFFPYLCIPMTAQGETLGVLHIQAKPDQSLEKIEQQASPVAVRVALALANLRLRESLRLQSIRDPLTGLFNRRYMEETLERELHRAARHQAPLGVIMLDIDYFKKFNDHFGHDVGDGLLSELGVFLRANVRSEDVPCRYGGEEFIIILPDANMEITQKRAAQLRSGVSTLKLQRQGQTIGPITLSIGVAGFPEHGASSTQLLQSVDAALYRAKRSGRDRVVLAEA